MEIEFENIAEESELPNLWRKESMLLRFRFTITTDH